jgi:catechol 2,3-dioxygenase-like lactoylglutathione lyase family enzyme
VASGVATVWLPVEDMSRALRFYAQTLGLSVRSEGEDWSELDADGATIGLNACEATHKGGTGGAVLTFRPHGDLIRGRASDGSGRRVRRRGQRALLGPHCVVQRIPKVTTSSFPGRPRSDSTFKSRK